MEATMMKAWKALATAAALMICSAQAALAQASIEEARWLAGRWVGEGLGGQIEEAWSEPAGGQMVGYFRLVREGRPAFYEIMLLEETEAGLRMRVKHFNPDFVGWEEKDAWATFEPVRSGPNELVFRSLSFRLEGEALIGAIRIRYGENDVRDEVLRYRRAPL
jgi:hypothetical protein